jgi:type IV secretory pathway VirB2 component (pilin)
MRSSQLKGGCNALTGPVVCVISIIINVVFGVMLLSGATSY